MEVSDPPDVFSILHDISNVSLFCAPCKEDGHYHEAEGYCVDCNHHLCETCLQHHRTPRPMRHHKLLDKKQMPQTKPIKVLKDKCTDKCSVHEDEILKYFCEDHNKFGCTVCVTVEHRTCKVGYIPTLSADLLNTDEYKSFKLALESMVRNTHFIQNTATRNLEVAKKNAEAVFVKIRKFRKEIDSFFDILENRISSRLTKIRNENQETIAEILKENKIMAEKLKKIENEMKDKEDNAQKCRLFVDIKQLEETIRELQKNIGIMEKNNTIQELTFTPSDNVTSFIRNKSETIGSLVCFHKSFTLDIDSSAFVDIVVLSRERFAIQCIQLKKHTRRIVTFNTKQTPTKVMSQMEASLLNGLTRVGENEIGLTTETGNIQIYSVTDKFVLKNTIQNTGLRNEIVYTNGLFIGFTQSFPYNLRIVNMNGDVIKTLPIEKGRTIFSSCYIAVHPDHTMIYVSDGYTKIVTCLTFEGEVKGEYKPGREWKPRGVAVSPNGLVYVSDSKNNKIHILTSDLKPHDEINGTRYGLHGLRGLAICDRERKLYVGMISGKSISVFSI